MKKVQYFSHDYNARNDIKLQTLIYDFGMRGVGIYWSLIEILYENKGVIDRTSIDSFCYFFHEEKSDVMKILRDYNLFESDGDLFWSSTANKRLEKRKQVSESRKKASQKRWGVNIPQAEPIAPMQIESNYLEELSKDKAWQEMVAMKYKFKEIDEVIHWLIKFKVDISINSTKHRNLADAKSHFNNWLRIQIDKQNKENYGSNKTRTEVEQRLFVSTHREDEHF